jgi:hypothetical protein
MEKPFKKFKINKIKSSPYAVMRFWMYW